jgi:hypothetical protein
MGGGGLGGGFPRTTIYARNGFHFVGTYAKLVSPVSVDFKEATVLAAAHALSTASGVNISVDPAVPASTRLSVSAIRIPLATILEGIASEAQLNIAPEGQGVILRPLPQLTVNGVHTTFNGSDDPWDPKWQQLLAAPKPITTAMRHAEQELPQAGAMRDPFWQALPSVTPSPEGYGGLILPAGPVNLQFALTGVGENTVVLATPSTGGAGEPGITLTLYKVQDGALRRISSTFHRLEGLPMGGRTRARRDLSTPVPTPGGAIEAPTAPVPGGPTATPARGGAPTVSTPEGTTTAPAPESAPAKPLH